MAEIPYPSGGTPSVRLDTARDVAQPHHPQPIGQDEELIGYLEQQRDYAHAKLQAHQCELAEQVSYHEREIARCQRVIASVGHALDGLDPQEKAMAVPQQMQSPTLGGMPMPHER